MPNAEKYPRLSLLEAIHPNGEDSRGKARKPNAGESPASGPRMTGRAEKQEGVGAEGLAPAYSESASQGEEHVARRVALADLLEPGSPSELRDAPRGAPVLRSDGTEATETAAEIPTFELPRRRARRPIGGYISFILCVLVPTIVAAVYYFGFASDQYVVEYKFAVRDSNTTVSTFQSAATSSMAATFGISTMQNATENYMVVDYMTSRGAVDELQKRIDLKALYSRPFIDDWARFDSSRSLESLTKYWKDMVKADFDTITGVASGEVRAFTKEDAYLIAKTLLSASQNMINEVARAPQREAVQYAEAEVKRAEAKLKAIRDELSTFRDKESVIDPTASVVVANATVAGNIRGSLAQYQADMATLRKQGVGPNAPQVVSLQMRIKATEEQLREVELQISKAKSGGDSAISQVVARYEALDMDRQFAQSLVSATMQTLEQARANALMLRFYITPFVEPVEPVSSTYPNRIVATLTVGIACLLLWTIALLMSRSIKEHLT